MILRDITKQYNINKGSVPGVGGKGGVFRGPLCFPDPRLPNWFAFSLVTGVSSDLILGPDLMELTRDSLCKQVQNYAQIPQIELSKS